MKQIISVSLALLLSGCGVMIGPKLEYRSSVSYSGPSDPSLLIDASTAFDNVVSSTISGLAGKPECASYNLSVQSDYGVYRTPGGTEYGGQEHRVYGGYDATWTPAGYEGYCY